MACKVDMNKRGPEIQMTTALQNFTRSILRMYPFPYGIGRLVDRTALRKMRFADGPLPVRCRDGFSMTVFLNDLIGRQLFLTGRFDDAIVRVLRRYMVDGDTFLDIGANVGYVSCSLLHKFPAAKVVSVEPQNDVFDLLRSNVGALGGTRAIALNVAVGEHNGVARMRRVEGNSGACRVVDSSSKEPGSESTEARLVTADEVIRMAAIERIELIKIDVEGYELQVLRSLVPALLRFRPKAILFEHGGDSVYPSGEIHTLLLASGYRIYGIRKSLFRWSLISVDELWKTGTHAHDYLALPAAPMAGQSISPTTTKEA